MDLFKISQISSVPEERGIYCWYILPSLSEADLTEITSSPEPHLKRKIDKFLSEKLFSYFAMPQYNVSLRSPLKAAFDGKVSHTQNISPISDAMNENLNEILNDINAFLLNKENYRFFSPVYIGKAKNLKRRLGDHSRLLRSLKNKSSTYEVETNEFESDSNEEMYAFAHEVFRRKIPIPWLHFSYLRLGETKNHESYAIIEGILNRITFPLFGRN